MNVRSNLLVLLAIVIGVTAVGADVAVKKGPYLMYDGNPTEMTVLWQLDGTEGCTIEWRDSDTYPSVDA